MRYRYTICDVFTSARFGGNQLAVLPDAVGLTTEQMQQIAREFNFSETTFVLPPEAGHTRRVRIFTPTSEIPFAGHPNIGTAFTLANAGELGDIAPSIEVTFEEQAGLVPITIHDRQPMWCELAAPEELTLGGTVPPEAFAAAVSLEPEDVVVETHPPQVASAGLGFLFGELRDRGALERARPDLEKLDALRERAGTGAVHLYVRSGDDFDIRARMFAPLSGVPEDPATGSASCALIGLLAHHEAADEGSLSRRIAQGVEMGRPSVLEARAQKRGGRVVGTWVGGGSVFVSEGTIEVD